MTWKKSKDGGIDYEVEELIEQQKEPEFNPFATAYTTTFNFNQEEVEFERPLTAREKIERFKRKRKYGR